MGNCCTGANSTNLILLGASGSGKTSVVRCLNGEPLQEQHRPTVGFSCEQLRLRAGTLYLWDVGGARGQRGQWARYVREAEGVVFVVDGAACSGPDQLRSAVDLLREVVRMDAAYGLPVALLVNKTDLLSGADEERVVRMLERLVAERFV